MRKDECRIQDSEQRNDNILPHCEFRLLTSGFLFMVHCELTDQRSM